MAIARSVDLLVKRRPTVQIWRAKVGQRTETVVISQGAASAPYLSVAMRIVAGHRALALRSSERLMWLFIQQMEALNRYRGKGQSEQRMTVEHVHVHQGGQAVLGNVTTKPESKPGGGG